MKTYKTILPLHTLYLMSLSLDPERARKELERMGYKLPKRDEAGEEKAA